MGCAVGQMVPPCRLKLTIVRGEVLPSLGMLHKPHGALSSPAPKETHDDLLGDGRGWKLGVGVVVGVAAILLSALRNS